LIALITGVVVQLFNYSIEIMMVMVWVLVLHLPSVTRGLLYRAGQL
jgi:hypothetical protein